MIRLHTANFAVVAAVVTLGLGLGRDAGALGASGADTRPPGPLPGGQAGITPNNWQVTPAGSKVRVGPSPFGMIPSPDGRRLYVSNDGYGQQSLMVIDRATMTVLQTLPYPSPSGLFVGLAATRDGKTLYASAGQNNSVRVYQVTDAGLTEGTPIVLGKAKTLGFVTGLALSRDDKTLYAANHLSGDVAVIDTASQTVVSRIAMGLSSDPFNTSKFPYEVLPTGDGKKLYVSNWKEGTLAVVDTSIAAPTSPSKFIRVGDHPNQMIFDREQSRLFVANANSDSVSVVDTSTDDVLYTIDVRAYPGAPLGTAPNALALSARGETLYVVNAGENAVAVVDLARPRKGRGEHRPEHGAAAAPYRVRGRIPVGWYPTGILVSDDGESLLVANSKDVGLGQNAYPKTYVGDQMFGSLSVIPVPDRQTLARDTWQVIENNRSFKGSLVAAGVPADGFLLRHLPIEHVIYVIKENRTYDQIFGDLPRGNGDPSLVEFDDSTAPNHRMLAENFVLLDNTYCDAEISKDGHEWSTGANATDYTEKVWPSDYSGRGTLINRALIGITNVPGGYLWDAANRAGISYRSYGEYVINGDKLADGTFAPITTHMTALQGHFAPKFRTYDLKTMDAERVAAWLEEFEQYKLNGQFPKLNVVSLPSDHLAGTSPGYHTPKAMMADNDLALGRLVEAVSHSSYWASTVIMVIEDDSQDGYDHVDSHRTPALVISPYVRRGFVDSTHYSTVSLVRSIEVLLQLPPMSLFDAAASTLDRSFTLHPDMTPYAHLVPAQDINEMNPAVTALFGEQRRLAVASAQLDLREMDAADSKLHNEIVWKAIKGAKAAVPRVRHTAHAGITLPLALSRF